MNMSSLNQYDNLEILTVGEMMEMLYIGKNTAYQLLNDGVIEAFRIGNTWKIPKAAVDRYIVRKCGRLDEEQNPGKRGRVR